MAEQGTQRNRDAVLVARLKSCPREIAVSGSSKRTWPASHSCIGLDRVPAGYRAMNERQALKVMIRP